jgi:hypothetical protein
VKDNMPPDVTKISFANFFNVFTDTSKMQNNELAFDSSYRLVYKDNTGVLRNIVSVNDYANIYAPNSVNITQIVKSAKVGVGTEGDFSAKVTKSMPLSNIVTATGIHNRLMLVQYDNNNNLKDTILFPEYFCKLGTYADTMDINKGIITEIIRKVKIDANLGVTTLTNNKIFKIYLTETTDVATTLNLPLTVEANKDVIANRNQMYIGADGYLYIIKDKAVSDLTYSFWVFNRRTTSVKVKVNTTIPLLEKNDNFVFESYRYVSDNIVGTSYQFVGSGETVQITKILSAIKTSSLGKEDVTLTISGDKKSVNGIQNGAYYTINVITDETPVIPSLVYQFLDVQDGFFGYLYTILKSINDNEHQTPIDIDAIVETVRLALLSYMDDKLLPKADLDSPNFIGVPKVPTAAVNTNTTQAASTAWVIGQASSASPLMDGAATIGVSLKYSREDHVHPIDTSRAPAASPTFTGTVTIPTAGVNTNTTQAASTAFVIGQAATATPLMAGVAAVGTATRFAREDHKHPIDTSRAAVDSPTFTTIVKTPDIDMLGNELWNSANLPIINMIPDSGRFMGNQQDPYAIQSGIAFTINNEFFAPYNGGNNSTGGKFIHNNTDNGGSAGSMTADAIALVNAMNTIAGADKRYGAEFHILDITQGSGTSLPHATNTSHYLLTTNNSKNIAGGGDYFTFSFWVRLKTGSGATISRSIKLAKNGIDVTASFLNISTADGWMHIQSVYKPSTGYDNTAPQIYAPSGAVIEIAIPVIASGGSGTGIHTSPIPRLDLGFTAASTASPTFTGTVTLPATTSIGPVTATELGYISGVTSSIQTQLNARATSASPTFTGTVTIPTAAVNTNTTQAASTAFVLGQAATASPLMAGVATVGTATKFAREDHVHPSDTSRAPTASPTFTGTVTIPTAAVNTNTTQAASTAFVLGQAGSASPVMNGTATVGVATKFAREDHVHPSDTAKADTASPTFTGTVTIPTAAVNTNTTQAASTAFVIGQAGSAAPLMSGTATVGTATKFSREDHIHPSDTSRAPAASPTFTGTVTIPTATVNTNTTQAASTAFVIGQAATASPLMAGTATVGVATRFAREDHIHPSDTSRAPTASPTFTGIVTVPTPANGDNSTKAATTAFINNLLSGNSISDGITWTARTSAADNQWQSICYGNGLYVAVAGTGTGNRVMTSPDGITWTTRTSAADNSWVSVCYGNGLFVAVAYGSSPNTVMTSTDGITWTIRSSGSWLRAVCYGNGLFVAVTDTTSVMTSPDGITWSTRTGANANQWNSVIYAAGLFVAVASTGTGNRVMTSPDGITWTARTSAADNGWYSICYGAGLFVAVAIDGTGNRVMTSPDAITWTIRTSAADVVWRSVAYGGGIFVAVAQSSTLMTSPDGITWTARTASSGNNWFSVCYNNGLFVAVATSGTGNRVMTNSGTPAAPLSVTTAAVNTNTNQIASTAFVLGQAATASPLMDGVATVGTSTKFAREDHVHASDTSRAPTASPTFTGTVVLPSTTSIGSVTATELGYLSGVTSSIQTQLNARATSASPTFTGTVIAPTPAVDNSSTQVSTTAWYMGQRAPSVPVMNGAAAIGSSLKWAASDHVHPSDTSRAAAASPTITGVLTASGSIVTPLITANAVEVKSSATTKKFTLDYNETEDSLDFIYTP